MKTTRRLELALETILNSGEITSESIAHLTLDEKDLVQTLYEQGLLEESLNFIRSLDSDTDWEKVRGKLIITDKKVVPLWKSVMRYAAVFIGVFAIGYLLHFKGGSTEKYKISKSGHIKLSLGDDNIKFVNKGESQEIKDPSGNVIAKQHGNTIKYATDLNITELVFHELEIPNGEIFNIELSDGTVVHLNSGSKLRYPLKFLKGQKREVFIQGEAYFEVTEDKEHPFTVKADAVAIEVLGTKFGVSTYKEDASIETVLVEGKISMSNSFIPEDAVVLLPGTKGTWHKTEHQTKVEKVDVQYYTGWMEGELIFRDATFDNMIKKLERWYDVTIENKNAVLGDKILNARFSKNIESIEDVLNYLNELQPFSYKINEDHILIY
ncbi:FecR family protein [Gelidibacter salicanalis]|uniref:FecR family protein n=1 Tax=Gelidibacter salicanalis TaxID=291193 RepID=A0A934KPC2_9FLAO|nr:FecR family protein [Gelidibacter salicanalis]MBJ7883012.1 FecR family protein [Gelidibacter salicanalis]